MLSVADLTGARTKRDAIFTELATQWRTNAPVPELDATSSRYQPAVASADDLSDTLRQNANRLAAIAGHEAKQNAANAELLAVQGDLDALTTQRTATTAEWVAEWATFGLRPRSPDEMLAWLQSAADIHRLAGGIDAAADLNQRLHARRAERLFDVGATLTALGLPPPAGDELEPVLARARDFLQAADTRETTRRTLTRDLAGAQRSLERAQRDTAAAETALGAVMKRWSETLAAAYLPADTPPSAFAEATALIAEFHNLAQRARHDRSRADGINRDNRQFAASVIEFSAACAPELTPLATTTPDAAALALDEELSRLKTAHDRRAQRIEQLAGERTHLERANAKIAAIEAALEPTVVAHGIAREALPQTLTTSKAVYALRKTIAVDTTALETATGLTHEECEEAYTGRTRPDIQREHSQATEGGSPTTESRCAPREFPQLAAAPAPRSSVPLRWSALPTAAATAAGDVLAFGKISKTGGAAALLPELQALVKYESDREAFAS